MKPPRNDATSAPDTSLTLPGARLRLRSWRWKSSALVLIWRQMTCWSPQNSGERWPSANQCRLHISAAFTSFTAWLVSQFAPNVGELSNGNTSLTVTAAGNAWIGKVSPKQRLSCLRNNPYCYIPANPASVLYLLAAFGMSFSPPLNFSSFPYWLFICRLLVLGCLAYKTAVVRGRLCVYGIRFAPDRVALILCSNISLPLV